MLAVYRYVERTAKQGQGVGLGDLKEAGDLGREIRVVNVALEQWGKEKLDRASHLQNKRPSMEEEWMAWEGRGEMRQSSSAIERKNLKVRRRGALGDGEEDGWGVSPSLLCPPIRCRRGAHWGGRPVSVSAWPPGSDSSECTYHILPPASGPVSSALP